MAHYRRYYVKNEEDGSYRVISHGGVIGAARWLSPVWLAMLVVAFFMALFQADWAAVGVFLLLIGICMPNFAKRRRQVIEQAHREGRPVPPTVPEQLIKRLRAETAPVRRQTWLERQTAGRTGGVLGGITAQRRAKDADPAPPPIPSADELAKLSALRDQGLLTDEEFATIKHRLISQGVAKTEEDPIPTAQEWREPPPVQG
jgi:hypothetical protein